MNEQTIECAVCGKQHEWSRDARHNYRETALPNGEFIDHCLTCDPSLLNEENHEQL